MLLYHDPSSTSIDECGGPRAADDVRHAPRIEMRNPVAGGHDSGVGAEHIDVHRGPLPLRILHVAADVGPERLDLLLESSTGDGDVAAAGRVDGPLLGYRLIIRWTGSGRLKSYAFVANAVSESTIATRSAAVTAPPRGFSQAAGASTAHPAKNAIERVTLEGLIERPEASSCHYRLSPG